MLTDEEWKTLLNNVAITRPRPVRAMEYRRSPFGSFASPPLLACDDGREYWVKHPRRAEGCPSIQRTAHLGGIVADQVVGRLGMKLGIEAVPSVGIVEINQALIDIENRLEGACPALAHGSENVGATVQVGRLFLRMDTALCR